MKIPNIRNFSIIAHIDHGKSTLADRLLEATNAVSQRDMESQLLDNMELERERGITIKARAVKLNYHAKDGQDYVLNLIDTPGHVDFNYEVSRSLAACEGAVLVVDAAQGIEAQTLANTYLALEHDLELLPVINKIDLPAADPERVKQEIEDIIGIDASEAPLISAKQGIGIDAVLEGIVELIPPPEGDADAPLEALIFDSFYDAYKGVIVYLRVFNGTLKTGDSILMMQTGARFDVVEVGNMRPIGLESTGVLSAGDVGYLTASIKNVKDTRVGDTVTHADNPVAQPLPGYRPAVPMVFSGIYPLDGAKYEDLREALEKLQLNDASLLFEPETSVALGFGFRCGFLGLLHMEIIIERLEREYNMELITTAPSVIYRITRTNGEVVNIDNPTNFPNPSEIAQAEEPIVNANIILPSEYVGAIMELCQERRGVYKDMKYVDPQRVNLHYELPLNEIIYDFFDALKSRTRGYASFDYEMLGYRKSDLVKLDILLNGDVVDALSFIVHADRAYGRGRRICEKLKETIPRQLFEVPIQAAIGGKIIARETVKAMRKDVLAKCYGGDITRKKKLLEKQKEGKKRMRSFGTVEVPPGGLHVGAQARRLTVCPVRAHPCAHDRALGKTLCGSRPLGEGHAPARGQALPQGPLLCRLPRPQKRGNKTVNQTNSAGYRPLGLYLHIPFCARKCPYCDFYSVEQSALIDDYLCALLNQMRDYAPSCRAYRLDTLFVGGGTPSLLSPRQWDRLLRGVEQNFRLSRDMEVTVEVNPDSTSQKQLSHLHRLGVNRLSIGAQSFDDTLLKAIGRLHSAQRIRETVREGPPCGL